MFGPLIVVALLIWLALALAMIWMAHVDGNPVQPFQLLLATGAMTAILGVILGGMVGIGLLLDRAGGSASRFAAPVLARTGRFLGVVAQDAKEGSGMWYPNQRQWAVIWVTTAIFLLLYLFSDNELDNRVGIAAVVVGGLLVWRFSKS